MQRPAIIGARDRIHQQDVHSTRPARSPSALHCGSRDLRSRGHKKITARASAILGKRDAHVVFPGRGSQGWRGMNATTDPRREAQRQAATARMRRARQRKTAGTMRIDFDAYAFGIDLLADLGWLAVEDRQDRTAVAAAIKRLANAVIAARMRPGDFW
jgi:hypothetical protein